MKLTKQDRLHIVELTKAGMSRKKIAEKYDIVHQHVTRVLRQFDEETNGEFHDQLRFKKKVEAKAQVYDEFILIGMSEAHADFAIQKWSNAYKLGYNAGRSSKQLNGVSSNQQE